MKQMRPAHLPFAWGGGPISLQEAGESGFLAVLHTNRTGEFDSESSGKRGRLVTGVIRAKLHESPFHL